MKEQILAVPRMQDYIEAHLEETIGLSDMSGVSLFSPWYSYRLFQEYTGLTPASYIRRLRLAKAALRLKRKTFISLMWRLTLALVVWMALQELFTGNLECAPATMPPILSSLLCSCLTIIDYTWDDSNPRIQLELHGNRGYFELQAIRKK